MKTLICLIAVACVMMFAVGAVAAEGERAKKAFKGVELYSWKDKAGEWRFVLVPGTNRAKGEEEVKGTAGHLKDVEAVGKAFAGLAEGESVFWIVMKGFELPAEKTRERIEKAGRDAGIELHVTARGE